MDKKLNFLTFAHNQIPNRTTGFSQETLIFGLNLRGVQDAVRETPIDGERQEEGIKKDVISQMVDLKERLRDVTERAKLNADKAHKVVAAAAAATAASAVAAAAAAAEALSAAGHVTTTSSSHQTTGLLA